jgi:eukaryotic-like serine/threonine-protein kinase
VAGPVEALMQRAQTRVGAVLRGKYTIERLLGVGGMCAVYRAVHRNGNRVAVKMMHPHIAEDGDVVRRFLQEGYAANNVDHPGVARVLDDDTAEDGVAFIVMELLEGETLAQHAARSGGVLPHRVVMSVAHQLLDVLATAKDKGIIHRDIKPENLFVTGDGTIKLLDFGLARILDKPSVGQSTVDGSVFGTPAFMPPEQAIGERAEVDHQSDLWAVGATMFTLLTGKFVHEAQTPTQQLLFTASRPARSLAEAGPGLPRPIVALVDRALRFAKSERWPSARAMQEALEEAFPALYQAPPPPRMGARAKARDDREVAPSSQLSMATTIKRDAGRSPLPIILALLACAVILIIAIALALLFRGEAPQSGSDPAGASGAPAGR